MARKTAKTPTKKPAEKDKKKLPALVGWQRIRCSRKLHVIGVTKHGALYIPNHTKEELTRQLNFRAMGGKMCKCAEFMHEWQTGQFTLSLTRELTEARPSRHMLWTDKMAHRLHRIVRRKQVVPNVIPRPLPTEPAAEMENSITEQVYETLTRRGLFLYTRDGREISFFYIRNWGDEDKKPVKFFTIKFVLRYGGYIELWPDGGYGAVYRLFEREFANPPVRKLADMIETFAISKRLLAAESIYSRRMEEAFEDRVQQLQQEFGRRHIEVVAQRDDVLLAVDTTYKGLTIGAARLMLQAMHQIRGRLNRINLANEKRSANPNRVPGPAGCAMGYD